MQSFITWVGPTARFFAPLKNDIDVCLNAIALFPRSHTLATPAVSERVASKVKVTERHTLPQMKLLPSGGGLGGGLRCSTRLRGQPRAGP